MSAIISSDGVYRYTLERSWQPGFSLPFVMLNPSTADAEHDDPTIRRCIGFAKRENYDGLLVVNLYAYRATDPREIRRAVDPVGPENDEYLQRVFTTARRASAPVVVAWGANPDPYRLRQVLRLAEGVDLRCLGTTAGGDPRHPLYVRGDQPLERWPA